jgi:hypothetical protein
MDAQNILNDDSGDFLSSLEGIDDFRTLWRGFGARSFHGISEIPAVKNRKPKNNSEDAHRVADSWFLEKFGVRYRSAALFCTGSKEVARHYGNIFAVIPSNGFTFCWSPKIRDLYSEISLSFIKPFDASSIINILEGGDYRISNLSDAIRSGCEIMVSAPRFYIFGTS